MRARDSISPAVGTSRTHNSSRISNAPPESGQEVGCHRGRIAGTDEPATLEATLVQFGKSILHGLSDPNVLAAYRLAIAESARAPEIARTLDKAARGLLVVQREAVWPQQPHVPHGKTGVPQAPPGLTIARCLTP
jgi:AefR-like transcriptional repressor, C-terminal domain